MDNAAKMFIDNEFYNTPDNSKYYYRIVGAGGVGHTIYANRDPNTDCHRHRRGARRQPGGHDSSEGDRPGGHDDGRSIDHIRLLRLGHRSNHAGPGHHVRIRVLLGRHRLRGHAAGRANDKQPASHLHNGDSVALRGRRQQHLRLRRGRWFWHDDLASVPQRGLGQSQRHVLDGERSGGEHSVHPQGAGLERDVEQRRLLGQCRGLHALVCPHSRERRAG